MIVAVNWQYIILTVGAGISNRVARRTGGPPPAVDGGTDMPNANNWVRAAPPSIHYVPDGRDYNFAFWSLNAQDMMSGQGSSQIQSNPTANESFTGGAWVITANAYYFWNFGTGGGDNAVYVDAFDVQAGAFLPDDFVDVAPDPGGALTVAGNNGYIDTTTQIAAGAANRITITARSALPPAGNRQFAYWQSVGSLQYAGDPAHPPTVGAPPNPRDIVVGHNDIVVAFAFYNEVRSVLQVPREPNIYNPWWWIETHGGLTPPGPPPPWLQQYLAGLALATTARGLDPRLRAEGLELALRQMALATSALKKDAAGLKRKK
jgi:hypothetical protein